MAVQYDEFATEHSAKAADTEARVAALQEAYDSSSQDVGRRLLRLDKSMRVVDEVDVRGMHERVHGLVRQFDETDIFVKHLQNKVRGWRARTWIFVCTWVEAGAYRLLKGRQRTLQEPEARVRHNVPGSQLGSCKDICLANVSERLHTGLC